jgi:DNA-binding response OmpR family regulator
MSGRTEDVSEQPQTETGVRVLVVVDDPEYEQLISPALEQIGGEVSFRAGDTGFLESLSEHDPAVLVLSQDLGSSNPLELLRQVRASERWRALPVYLVATEPDTEFELQGYLEGADAVLQKQTSVAELSARVRGQARMAAQQADRAQRAHEGPDHEEPGANGAVPDVIVIEDDPSLVEMLRYALENRGYGVLTHSSGPEALETLKSIELGQQQPIVLLDVDLPGLDGFEILQDIEEARPAAFRIIICTLVSSEASQVLALQNGAVDYIIKPLRMPVVIAKVERHLRARRSG